MKIILLETLNKLGKAGEIVSVKDGFAKNFLIPQKKAIFANKRNIDDLETKMSQINKNNEKKINEANSLKSKLNEKEITIQMESNEDGKLYGNIGPKIIIEELKKKYNVSLLPENIVLGNIRELGNYTINLRLYDDISADLKIEITKRN